MTSFNMSSSLTMGLPLEQNAYISQIPEPFREHARQLLEKGGNIRFFNNIIS